MRGAIAIALLAILCRAASAADSDGLNWLWLTAPRTNEELYGLDSFLVTWDSNLGEGIRYTVVFSHDEKSFNTVIASGIDECQCEWDLTKVTDLMGWIKVKAYNAAGYLVAEDVVPVSFVPRNAVVVSKANQKVFYFKDGDLENVFICSTALPRYDLAPGRYKVYYRSRNHHSREYDVDMPYALFFHQGYALHATRAIRRLGRPASHGCIRLHPRDAKTLFGKVEVGTPVIVLPKSRDCSRLVQMFKQESAPDPHAQIVDRRSQMLCLTLSNLPYNIAPGRNLLPGRRVYIAMKGGDCRD